MPLDPKELPSVASGYVSRSSGVRSSSTVEVRAYVCAQRANFRTGGHQTERLLSMLAEDLSSHFPLLQLSLHRRQNRMSSCSSERAAFARSPSPSAPMITSQASSERSPSVTATFSPKVSGIPCVAAASRYTAPVHIDVGGTIYTSSLETLTK